MPADRAMGPRHPFKLRAGGFAVKQMFPLCFHSLMACKPLILNKIIGFHQVSRGLDRGVGDKSDLVHKFVPRTGAGPPGSP